MQNNRNLGSALKKQRVSVARIFLSHKAAKPQRRREGICLFPFLRAFAALREPFFVAPAQAGAYRVYRPSAALSGETR
jgi:hypothetical protein